MGQCGQRHHAAFAIVVGAHDEADIFEGDHDHQGPDDQRHRAHHGGLAGRRPAHRDGGIVHGVKRAGADVAKHNAQSAYGEAQAATEGNVGVLFQGRMVVCWPKITMRGIGGNAPLIPAWVQADR